MSQLSWIHEAQQSPPAIDHLLEPLLLMNDSEQADEFLTQLITTHATPIISGIIRYKLRFSSARNDARGEAEDLQQEAIAQLLIELQKLRRDPETYPIKNVRGLVARITYRLCARWMSRQFPAQHALRNRMQYLLTHQSGFALWPDQAKKMIAGFAAWRGRKASVSTARLRQLSQGKNFLALFGDQPPAKLNDLLAAIFNYLGGAVEFDELVKVVAALWQIKDPVMVSVDNEQDADGMALTAREADIAWHVEKRIFLQRLWEEVRQLPTPQRAALLLNLRDTDGRGCLALFPATGIATTRQLAETLELSVEKFAEIWNDLPLEDAKIAALLQLTRQQVINLRKSAHERLARRLKGFI